MDDEIVFENVWGATLGYGRMSVIREEEDDLGEAFPPDDYDITVILTPKLKKFVPGWYMDQEELETPVDRYDGGTATDLAYYTQSEIDSGITPPEGSVRVQVVPYVES